MSDHIPFELQVDIIKRLPIKLLIQARSVSKAWKSVIDSPDFIADYTVHNHDQPQHLLISEEFGEIYLPNELAFRDKVELHLFNYCDSLAVIRQRILDDMIQVWRKGNGDSKSFIKLFTIKKPYRYMSSLPLGFRMTGELMMRKANNGEDSETLIDYDLFSHHINDLGIESKCSSLLVCSYKESLILLDQSDI
ncbi:putative F-box domain-containing protein [Helianthus annuus]|uniref:F-box domain-containing protein n=1 Tax=Helianthus annuus TaxID=4232 RepID=A0A9K3JZ79_HELAN|nr:putative F-box domain-containing protein [Helianthus annuus]